MGTDEAGGAAATEGAAAADGIVTERTGVVCEREGEGPLAPGAPPDGDFQMMAGARLGSAAFFFLQIATQQRTVSVRRRSARRSRSRNTSKPMCASRRGEVTEESKMEG